ncbi:hypothetical protein VTK26DRAFT_1581 [Humicola hyalothermophila]
MKTSSTLHVVNQKRSRECRKCTRDKIEKWKNRNKNITRRKIRTKVSSTRLHPVEILINFLRDLALVICRHSDFSWPFLNLIAVPRAACLLHWTRGPSQVGFIPRCPRNLPYLAEVRPLITLLLQQTVPASSCSGWFRPLPFIAFHLSPSSTSGTLPDPICWSPPVQPSSEQPEWVSISVPD